MKMVWGVFPQDFSVIVGVSSETFLFWRTCDLIGLPKLVVCVMQFKMHHMYAEGKYWTWTLASDLGRSQR